MVTTPEEPSELLTAFVDAYPGYVADRLVANGIAAPDDFGAAVERGARWLRAELEDLLDLEPARQRRSPLEVFQQALEEPTAALAAAGIPPVERDEVARRALPGDLYDLAPASSQALGEQAWRAHVAWGIAKAQAVVGMVPAPAPRTSPVQPLAVLVGVDLMDRTRIETVVRSAGFGFEVWRNPAAVEAGLDDATPAVVFVDLNHATSDDAIRACTAAGVRTIAFGPHVDDVGIARARTLGAADAVPRSRFFSRLELYLEAMA